METIISALITGVTAIIVGVVQNSKTPIKTMSMDAKQNGIAFLRK